MEDNFDQTNFEEFLQKQVRNHRMYPSDTVWRDINKKLHGDKKWPALTIAAFALLSITIAICFYFPPRPDIFTIKSPSAADLHSSPSPIQHDVVVNNNKATTRPVYKEKSKQSSENNFPKNSSLLSPDITTANNRNVFSIPEANLTSKVNKNSSEINTENSNQADEKIDNSAVMNSAKALDESKSLISIPPDKVKPSPKKKAPENLPVVKDYNDKNMVDGFLKEQKNDISLYTASKVQSLKNKFSYQIYVAPSVTYRNLIEDRSILKNNNTNTGPVGLNYVADVNKVVRHKPGYGFETGVSIMYNLSNKFRIKSGFQFNVRQYSIEAYHSGRETSSIALIDNNRIDTVNTIAIYRNSNGYSSAELVNRYYQISIPLGIEWEVIGNKKVKLNIAASIQPTYLLNHNAYLLSTNFKNYSENPEMVRSWNLNSNVEAFLSFKVGDYKWQLGPQLRYQPYSTFIRQYPIKEHLMDYGFKIGVSKTIN